MPDIGLLMRLIERESVEDNWESVLRLLDRLEPLADPDDQTAAEFSLYHRAYALLELNRHGEAAESLERLVECDDTSAHYRLLHADALIRAEEWKEAIRQLEAGLAAEPDHPGCLCALGWTLYQTGQRKLGCTLLERTLEIHPHYFPAHLDLGLIRAAEGRWDESRNHLHCALAGAPDDPEILEVLEAVEESRARADAEKRRIRKMSPVLRQRRRRAPAAEVRALHTLRRRLRKHGASGLEILLTETLWLDFAELGATRPTLDAGWAAAVNYASHRLRDNPTSRAAVAAEWGVSPSTLDRRLRLLRTRLDLQPDDARYTSATLLDEPEAPAPKPAPVPPAADGRVIRVDFVGRRRLDDGAPNHRAGSDRASFAPPSAED